MYCYHCREEIGKEKMYCCLLGKAYHLECFDKLDPKPQGIVVFMSDKEEPMTRHERIAIAELAKKSGTAITVCPNCHGEAAYLHDDIYQCVNTQAPCVSLRFHVKPKSIIIYQEDLDFFQELSELQIGVKHEI